MRRVLVAAFFASSMALCGAEAVCPWINTATASGILGSDATVAVDHRNPNSDDGICTFTTAQKTDAGVLRIEVKTETDPVAALAHYRNQCSGAITAVKGIGNEAFVCRIDEEARLVEQLAGRVRDRVFTVRASASRQSVKREILIDRVQLAASQVSGNLF